MLEKKRVKEMLKEAYLDLLCEKDYLSVTVTDLVAKAKVSRVSFYRIYGSFEAILNAIANDFYEMLKNEFLPLFLNSSIDARKQFLKAFFVQFKEDKVRIHAVLPENVKIVFSRIEDLLIPKNDLTNIRLQEKYLPAVTISFLITIVRIWSMGGFKEGEDEMVDFTYALLETTLNVNKPARADTIPTS